MRSPFLIPTFAIKIENWCRSSRIMSAIKLIRYSIYSFSSSQNLNLKLSPKNTIRKWYLNGTKWFELISLARTLTWIWWQIMKVLQCVQNSYRMLGIHRPQPNRPSSMSSKNLLILLIMVQAFISTTAFCLFDGKTVSDYGYSFYTSVTVLFNTGYFLVNIWKIETILVLIERIEGFIGKRKQTLLFPSKIIEPNSFWMMK